MRLTRPRLRDPKARRHGVKPPAQFESPARNWDFIRHMNSPWSLIALFLIQIVMLVLIMILFGYAQQFSDYLNQRGQFADREHREQTQAVCQLIGELRADPGGQLAAIAKRLHCPNGPLPRASGSSSSPSSVPIDPTTSLFTSHPTRGSRVPTGTATASLTAGNRPTGTKVPVATSGPSRPTGEQTTTPPASTSRSVPSGGETPTPPASPPQLCVPFTHLCAQL